VGEIEAARRGNAQRAGAASGNLGTRSAIARI
jgi:hypothetical protein